MRDLCKRRCDLRRRESSRPDAWPYARGVASSTDSQRSALMWASIVAIVVIFWIILPIGIGILLGTFLAFMAEPIFEHLEHRIGRRWASVATVTAASLALAAVLGGLGTLFVTRGTVLVSSLADSLKSGGDGDRAVAQLAQLTERVGVSRADLTSHAQSAIQHIAAQTADIAATIAATTGGAMLGLFFAMMAMFYVLRNWPEVSRRAQETLPLKPEYTLALFDEFRIVGRTTLLGAIGTGLAQGTLASVGFLLAGVPEPLFFGAATAVASFIPAVGTLIVTIPVGLVLLLSNHILGGTVELAWSIVLVVGVCDYVIRPRLVRGESKVPALVTFAALFGGAETFGLKGLILGPVLMSLALAVLRLYGDEARSHAQPKIVPAEE
jgi:predicted PurR-regulated permease PerM